VSFLTLILDLQIEIKVWHSPSLHIQVRGKDYVKYLIKSDVEILEKLRVIWDDIANAE
jgi:hypothetical protein